MPRRLIVPTGKVMAASEKIAIQLDTAVYPTISPSLSGLSSGIPWITTSFTETQSVAESLHIQEMPVSHHFLIIKSYANVSNSSGVMPGLTRGLNSSYMSESI